MTNGYILPSPMIKDNILDCMSIPVLKHLTLSYAWSCGEKMIQLILSSTTYCFILAKAEVFYEPWCLEHSHIVSCFCSLPTAYLLSLWPF